MISKNNFNNFQSFNFQKYEFFFTVSTQFFLHNFFQKFYIYIYILACKKFILTRLLEEILMCH